MDVIVTAGGIPQHGEPLYELTQGKPKALLELASKPMIQWVLEAVDLSKAIQKVVLVGMQERYAIQSSKPIFFLPQQAGMFENLYTAAKKLQEINPTAKKVIALSSDVPCITAEMLDWFAAEIQKSDNDVYYTVITRKVMEARYPGAKRSYYKLKDVEVCGADVHAFDLKVITHRPEIWRSLIETRKNAFKQAQIIGLDVFLAFLFQRWSLEQVASRVSQKIGIHGRVIISPYAEMGMDVDKPSQYRLVLNDIKNHQ